MADAKPYPKASQLARGERRYRRKVASPKQWQAIIAAKGSACRLSGSSEPTEVDYHHVLPRDLGGDDVADNIVPLCWTCHEAVTARVPHTLAALAASLSDAEYAYVVGKVGEDGFRRLFGVERS